MFLRFKSRKLIRKQRITVLAVLLHVVTISSICYFTLSRGKVKNGAYLRRRLQPGSNTFITEVHDAVHPLNISIVQGPYNDKTETEGKAAAGYSSILSQNNVNISHLIMDGCPVDWPLEVLRHDSAGIPMAQVCRSRNGDGQWTCAKLWKKVPGDPFCIIDPTPPTSNEFVSSIEENYDFQSPRQFVAENFKLLFHQLPGTVVEIPRSVFRVLRKEDTFDKRPFQHYHKFTIIMHPCLRLIKLWKVISSPSMNVSFTSFLNGRLFPSKPLLLLDESRLKTQTDMLFDDHRRIQLDQLLVLEHWNESLSELKRRSKIDPKSSQFIGAMSSHGEQCPRMYNPETWSKMINSYALDFCLFQYSTSINETQVTLPLNLTMQALALRFDACRRRASDFHTSSLLQSSHSIVTLPNPCTIHTYYQPAYDDPDKLFTNENVLNLWKESWTSAGWQTRVLNEFDAMRHPDYKYLKEKFLSFPTVSAIRYTYGNLLRHVAMAVVGGGWMADFDTLPLHFPPCKNVPLNGSYTVWSGFVPAIVSGRGDEYTRVAHLMADVGIQWRARPNVFVQPNGHVQVSDMLTLSVLVKENLIHCSDVIIGTEDYLHEGFACSKTRHYPIKFCSVNVWEGIPWAVHLSHAYMTSVRKSKLSLWKGMSWEDASSPYFRQNFMQYVYKIYLEKCHLKGKRRES